MCAVYSPLTTSLSPTIDIFGVAILAIAMANLFPLMPAQGMHPPVILSAGEFSHQPRIARSICPGSTSRYFARTPLPSGATGHHVARNSSQNSVLPVLSLLDQLINSSPVQHGAEAAVYPRGRGQECREARDFHLLAWLWRRGRGLAVRYGFVLVC